MTTRANPDMWLLLSLPKSGKVFLLNFKIPRTTLFFFFLALNKRYNVIISYIGIGIRPLDNVNAVLFYVLKEWKADVINDYYIPCV